MYALLPTALPDLWAAKVLRLVEMLAMSLTPPPRPSGHLRLIPSPRNRANAPMPDDDAHLVAGVRAGDSAVARRLYDRLSPVVMGTTRKLLGRNDPDIDDVAQSAYVALVTSIDSYRGDSTLQSWASTITAHTVFKHLRRRKLERAAFVGESDAHTESYADQHGHPAATAEQRSTLHKLNAVISGVDPLKRWTYFLHDVMGYDLREIAQITEVSVAAAQTRLVRGRAEIHARIAGTPELVEDLNVWGGDKP